MKLNNEEKKKLRKGLERTIGQLDVRISELESLGENTSSLRRDAAIARIFYWTMYYRDSSYLDEAKKICPNLIIHQTEEIELYSPPDVHQATGDWSKRTQEITVEFDSNEINYLNSRFRNEIK